jgi:hypothetical protein
MLTKLIASSGCADGAQPRAQSYTISSPYPYNLDIEMPVKAINSYAEFTEIASTVAILFVG